MDMSIQERKEPFDYLQPVATDRDDNQLSEIFTARSIFLQLLNPLTSPLDCHEWRMFRDDCPSGLTSRPHSYDNFIISSITLDCFLFLTPLLFSTLLTICTLTVS